MKKENFKVGDRVYHASYGWGVVASIDGDEYNPINVKFDVFIISFTKDGKEDINESNSLLSFTEYTLQGFTQERPIVLPEVGELCLVRDYETDSWLVREFAKYEHGLFICKAVHSEKYVEWKYMKRIKILD
jgi:hypothetical protein